MSLKRFTSFTENEEVEKIEKIDEEKLLRPITTTNNLDIEILEEKIIKFNKGELKDILETLKAKYSDTDYFIRKKGDELHVVKYNEGLKLNINEFVNSLLHFYSKGESRKITEGIKVKGNNKFSIIEHMKSEYSGKFIDDLIILLAKKNKE